MATELADTGHSIPSLREASRRLVREWGFLAPTLAGSPLSASATHCLIEIGDHGINTFEALGDVLFVDPDQLARALAELTANGDIFTRTSARAGSPPGGYTVIYGLTPAGAVTLAAINAFAQDQAERALGITSPDVRDAIVTAFQQYATALQKVRVDPIPTPDLTPLPSPRPSSPSGAQSQPQSQPPAAAERNVSILAGYRPRILARALDMHIHYYSQTSNWGAEFEASLASGLGGLMTRLSKPMNEAWAAIETDAAGREHIIGTIFIDGEDLGAEGVAHLRAFIVDESSRGLGLGRKLFEAAMQFVDEKGFSECRLWTMRSLMTARRLYEARGFVEVAEEFTTQFGAGAWIMEYRWLRGDTGAARMEKIDQERAIDEPTAALV